MALRCTSLNVYSPSMPDNNKSGFMFSCFALELMLCRKSCSFMHKKFGVPHSIQDGLGLQYISLFL